MARQPGDRVERAYQYHRLDHVGLNPILLSVSGGSGATAVAGHHTCLTTNGDQNPMGTLTLSKR